MIHHYDGRYQTRPSKLKQLSILNALRIKKQARQFLGIDEERHCMMKRSIVTLKVMSLDYSRREIFCRPSIATGATESDA